MHLLKKVILVSIILSTYLPAQENNPLQCASSPISASVAAVSGYGLFRALNHEKIDSIVNSDQRASVHHGLTVLKALAAGYGAYSMYDYAKTFEHYNQWISYMLEPLGDQIDDYHLLISIMDYRKDSSEKNSALLNDYRVSIQKHFLNLDSLNWRIGDEKNKVEIDRLKKKMAAIENDTRMGKPEIVRLLHVDALELSDSLNLTIFQKELLLTNARIDQVAHHYNRLNKIYNACDMIQGIFLYAQWRIRELFSHKN